MSILAQHLPRLRRRIDAATEKALERALDLGIDSPQATEITEAAHRSICSGKRFRAIGAYIGAAVATGSELGATDVIDDLGAALELYQASALAHDDVIDHADTRRGTPTPHRVFAGLHRDNSWLGDAEHFGEASAILLGDLLFSSAEDALQRCVSSLPALRGSQVFSRYVRMHTEVALGQYLDIRAEQTPLNPHEDSSFDRDIIMEVVRLKSARYSVVHPVLLGATALGAMREFLTLLESIIEPWGMAFQFRDDELGIFGDPEVTGKPAGDDLIEGKRTLLMSLTWQNATRVERSFITDVLTRPRTERSAYVSDLRDVIAHRGSQHHEASIRSLVDQGNNALQDAQKRGLITEESAALLQDLGQLLTARRS